jgi:hypothetical protein
MKWFKIVKGGFWNPNMVYIAVDIVKLHKATIKPTLPDHKPYIEGLLNQIRRKLNYAYSEITYKQDKATEKIQK